jgi:hypothetical protein
MLHRWPPGVVGTILFQRNNDFVRMKTGRPLSAQFKSPFLAELDDKPPHGTMATFYESPAFITTRAFYKDLMAAGVSNVEMFPVVIKDPARKIAVKNYVLLNIVGRMGTFALKRVDFKGLPLFVADEDTDIMIVSERVQRQLARKNYADVVFEELT